MSILGIGSDLVEIDRIRRVYQAHGMRFAERLLADVELVQLRAAADPAALLARRFAAKEAAAKALGCGIGAEAGFRELVVDHNELGAPQLNFLGGAEHRAEQLGVRSQHLSISDERAYALAFVVLEGQPA